jgi:hypothetical protein
MDPAGTSWFQLADGIPRDITVLKTNTTVVYEDGTRADISNGVYDHHTFMVDVDRQNPKWYSCGGKAVSDTWDVYSNPGGSLLFGGSEDKYGSYYTTPTGNVRSGFYIGPKDRLAMNGDLINYTNETKYVYTMNEIEYIPGKLGDGGEASMYVMVPGQCSGGFGITLPQFQKEKVFSMKGSGFTVIESGKILAFRGHLHGTNTRRNISSDD